MGVHDLWRLLAPCGHRLSLTTLTRRKLAVDVSIWIQQFLKALPTSQPHLLGLLRRLCKLHYYHIYPVMVFDGPAPNLKKRTLEERRRTRERQRESFERVAERLLLEQLKMKSVKELRRQMARRRKEDDDKKKEEQKEVETKGTEREDEEMEVEGAEDDDVIVVGDETSSPSGRGKKAVRARQKRVRAAAAVDEHKDDPVLMAVIDEVDDDPELLLLRQLQQEEDNSASLDLIAQWEGQADDRERSSTPALFVAQPLTALTAEERKLGLAYDYISPDEEADDPLPVHDALSYQLPANGQLDSSVLASLPISLQYSLLEQHRSHHHNMSLRRYAQVKDDTAAFSAMQMGAFLKQVQFNKEIEVKRLEMNMREERDGMRVKRLAGDGSREYVYMRKDERKEKEEKKRVEEAEEASLKEEARQQMEREESRYLSSHINRITAQDDVEWRCTECGTRNRDDENDVSGMCHICGTRRTERHAKGGTVGILLGADDTHKQSNNNKPTTIKRTDSGKADTKVASRVTTFHTLPASSTAQPTAAVYWGCKQCSFLNHMHVVKCEICGAKKEDDAHTATLDHGQTQSQPHNAQHTARDSNTDVVHVSDDEMEEVKDEQTKKALQLRQDESKVEQTPAAPVVTSSESVEISFDATALDDGDDLFPADFFDAFDQSTSIKSHQPPTRHTSAPTAAAASTDTIASPTKTHLTLGESIKQRRPRMRLKKLDVKEIIWFDEDELHTQHTFDKDADTLVTAPSTHSPPAHHTASATKPAPPRPPGYVEEVKEESEVATVYDERVVSENDEVEEIVVRGRVKVVSKVDGNKKQQPSASEPKTGERVELTERFLEQDYDAGSDGKMEGKYDSDEEEENKYDSDGEGQHRGNTVDDAEEEVDEKEQLRRAIALSMTYPVHRMDDNDDEVQEMTSRHGATDSAPPSRRMAVRASSRQAREKRMLDIIAEEEAEMAVELKERQREDDTDEVMVVQTDTTLTSGESEAVKQSAAVSITTLQHNAERVAEEEPANRTQQAENIVSSVQPSTALVQPSTADTPANAEPSPSAATIPAAPRGFVLPSLASLSTSTAAQPTNLFFAEKQKREQERKEREAAQTAAAATHSSAPDQPASSSLSSTASPSPSVQSPSVTSPATTSSPSLSAFPASAPVATWNSASDDPANAAEPSVDAHLSDIYTDSHALSSSLARLKSKQAKQQQQVTTAMLDECRHLLALFGCPYIIAPAEAEAQCATLEQLGLVDGVVTEDSDVFLFGARHVYRNIFEQKKYAERYRIDEIAAVLGVDRDGLISLALLLGSDYTLGVHGVGIVNAMEIVNAFPGAGNDGLREFREWVYSGSVEKRPKVPQLLEATQGETEADKAVRDKHNAGLVSDYRQRLFKFKHRNLRSAWHVSRDFPSDVVRQGYEQPMVDKSEEALSWSKPRWDDIIAFLREKFAEEESERRMHAASLDGAEEEYISMVKTLRVAYEEEEARVAADPYYQARLDSYFREDDKFAVVASKRINTAIAGLTKKKAVEEKLKEKEAKRRKKKQEREDTDETDDKENESVVTPQKAAEGEKASPGRGGKRGRGGRGRGSSRGGEVSRMQAGRREARERRQREDAEWIDDDVVLVEDDEDDDDGDWNGGSPSRGRGRGRGKAGRARGGGKRSRAAG